MTRWASDVRPLRVAPKVALGDSIAMRVTARARAVSRMMMRRKLWDDVSAVGAGATAAPRTRYGNELLLARPRWSMVFERWGRSALGAERPFANSLVRASGDTRSPDPRLGSRRWPGMIPFAEPLFCGEARGVSHRRFGLPTPTGVSVARSFQCGNQGKPSSIPSEWM